MGSLFLATSFTACKWESRCKDFRLESEIRKPTQSIPHVYSYATPSKLHFSWIFLQFQVCMSTSISSLQTFSRLWIHGSELSSRRAFKNTKIPHDICSIAVFWIYRVWGLVFMSFLLLPFNVCKWWKVRCEDFISESGSRIHTQSGSARGLGPLSARYGGAPSA